MWRRRRSVSRSSLRTRRPRRTSTWTWPAGCRRTSTTSARERENEEFRKYACSSIVGDLLTVVDDLDRALEHAGDETEFVKGIRGVRANMMKVLEANGLKEIPAEGRFDPDYHEALCTVDGDEDGLIAEVFQKGYTLNGKVLRYAKVKVTKKKAATEGEEKCQE